MEALLGSSLLAQGGKTVPTADALGGTEVVAIYFSAHWCPPCRGFTPQLAEMYKEIKDAGKSFEIVFASSDRDAGAFGDYFGEMPWLALPYDQRDAKDALSKKYKVQGIPTLVVLDGADGSVITLKGREAVMAGPATFPWKPKALGEILHDQLALTTKDGATTLADVRARTSHLAFYFSAHWCPPCKRFTPKFAATYNKLLEAGDKKLEVVYVSGDRDEGQFDEYYATMPWTAVPYAQRGVEKELSSYFDVEGIPSLVILESDSLAVVNTNTVGLVGSDAEGKNFPWAPPLVNKLDEDPGDINGTPTLVVLYEEAPDQWDAVMGRLEAVKKELVASAKASGHDVPCDFAVAEELGGLGGQIRKLAGVGMPKDGEVTVLMIDCPSGGSIKAPAGAHESVDALRSFVKSYQAGELSVDKFSR